MSLNIKSQAAEEAVRALVALTGESVTTAVQRAAEERLSRIRRTKPQGNLAAELLDISRRCAALPDLDKRTPEEILGYNEHGLPA
jgi:antitoxin VapB